MKKYIIIQIVTLFSMCIFAHNSKTIEKLGQKNVQLFYTSEIEQL